MPSKCYDDHRKCVKCGKTRSEDKSVAYHRFPSPGSRSMTKALAWAKYCWPHEDFSLEALQILNKKGRVLCSRHFASSQFYDDKRQKLSVFAVPDSKEVQECLGKRENIFNEDVEESAIQKGKVKTSVSVQASTSTVQSTPVACKPEVIKINFSSKNVSNVQESKAEETRVAESDNNNTLSSSSDARHGEDEISNDLVNQEKSLPIQIDDTTINKENRNVSNKIVAKAQVGKFYKVEYVNNRLRLFDYCPAIGSNINVDENKPIKDSVQIDNLNKVNLENKSITYTIVNQVNLSKEIPLVENVKTVNLKNETIKYKIVKKADLEKEKIKNIDEAKWYNSTVQKENVKYTNDTSNVTQHMNVSVQRQVQRSTAVSKQQEENLKSANNLDANPDFTLVKAFKDSNLGAADLYRFDTNMFTTDKNRMFITYEDINIFKSGGAMVLIPLNKHSVFRETLEELQKQIVQFSERIKRYDALNNEVQRLRLFKEKITKKQNEQGSGKVNNALKSEVNRLRRFKEQISKTFTETQINAIMNSKHCEWPDNELERVAFLKQNISQRIYLYLKFQMRFPLPSPLLLRKWMVNKQLINSKKKRNEDTPQDARQMVEENEQVEESGGVSELLQAMRTAQVQSEDKETARAIGSIVQVEHNQHLYIQSQTENPLMEPNDGMNNDLEPALSEVIIPQSDTTKIRRKHADFNRRCQLCIKYFETEVQVRQHVPLHYYNTHYTNYLDAQAPFQCEFCGENVRTRKILTLHHRTHLGINTFRCSHPGCTYVTNGVKKMTQHSRQHSNSNLQCEFCPARFPYRQLLNLHRNRVHSARVKRRCRLCFAVTLNDYTFRRHMRAHTRPPKFKCSEPGCTEAFYSAVDRTNHKVTSHFGGELPYKCPHCPHAAYAHTWLLGRHMRRHETDKINHCLKCDQMFYDYGEYFEHCVTQHRESKPSFKCACSVRFKSKKKLNSHRLLCDYEKENVTELQAEGSNVTQENTQDGKTKRKRSKKQITDAENNLENKKLRRDTEYSVTPTQIIENILVSEVNNQHVEHDAGGEDATLSMPVIIDGTVPSDVITMTLEEYQQYLLSTQENSNF